MAQDSDVSPSQEPQVTIHEGKNERVEEYRMNGFLYAIKVIPKNAPPYYLVAADGKGNFVRSDSPNLLIPSWKILTW